MQKWVPDATFNYRKYLPYNCPFAHVNSFVYEFDDSSINHTQDINSTDIRVSVNGIFDIWVIVWLSHRDINNLHGMANCLECSGIKFILLLLRRNWRYAL